MKQKGKYKSGLVIKELRESLNPRMTQSQLAKKIGVNRTSIYEIENGIIGLSEPMRKKILKALNKDSLDFGKIAYKLKIL